MQSCKLQALPQRHFCWGSQAWCLLTYWPPVPKLAYPTESGLNRLYAAQPAVIQFQIFKPHADGLREGKRTKQRVIRDAEQRQGCDACIGTYINECRLVCIMCTYVCMSLGGWLFTAVYSCGMIQRTGALNRTSACVRTCVRTNHRLDKHVQTHSTAARRQTSKHTRNHVRFLVCATLETRELNQFAAHFQY